jgi:hypothetical protein
MASFGISDADLTGFSSIELIVLISTEITRKVSQTPTVKF